PGPVHRPARPVEPPAGRGGRTRQGRAERQPRRRAGLPADPGPAAGRRDTRVRVPVHPGGPGEPAEVRAVHAAQRDAGLAGPEGRRQLPDPRHADRGRGQVAALPGRGPGVQAVLGPRDRRIMSAGSRVRRVCAIALAVVAAGTAVGVGYAALDRPRTGAGTAPVVHTHTATVTRGTVTEREQVSGTLGYDGSYPVANHLAPGTVTVLADPGATVSRGGILYAVDNQPVRLLYGTFPAYRGFAAGMTDGPDVAELETNLAALGFDPGHAMTV